MGIDTKRQLNLLIVENNNVDINLLQGMLNPPAVGSFSITLADCLVGAKQLLRQNSFDVVLLDLNLPDSEGLETLESLAEHSPDIAIVINTGAYEDDLGIQSISKGAQDYLIKGKYKSYGLSKALYYALERKRVELELQQANTRIKEAQSQLIQIEKLNIIGGLASGIAHEVKNPLATIFYGIEYLAKKVKTDDEKITLTITSIKESALRARNIVNDLLDFATVSELKRTASDINTIVEKSLGLTKVVLDKHRIRVNKWLTEDLPNLELDPNRIEQVLVDLILNSVNAIHNGGEIVVRTFQTTMDGNTAPSIGNAGEFIQKGDAVVIAEIEDTGDGIPDEIRNKIFDPFFTTRKAKGGVGLGLSVVRNIVRMHKGEIAILNKEQGGARVRLLFKI